MRANEQSSERASALASVVLPTPGTSSTSTCPSASSATTARSTIAASPLTASRTFAITRSAASRALSRPRCSASAASIALILRVSAPGRVQSCSTRSSTAPAIARLGARATCVTPSARDERDLVVIDVEADVGARDVVEHDQVDALAHALGLGARRRRRRPPRRIRPAPGPAGGAAASAARTSAVGSSSSDHAPLARAFPAAARPAGSRRPRPP